MAETGNCRLCDQERELCQSHILPKFAIRWLKKTSVSKLRGAPNANVPVQDGLKLPFLCRSCEDLFESWETPFAAQVFYPLQKDADEVPQRIAYGSWALKFAVSVSWRVLKLHSEEERFSTLPPHIIAAANRALRGWKEFLRDERPHPAEFEQHLLPLALVGRPVPGISEFFNRYIVRSIDEDLATGDETMLVYSKLGKIVLFGVVPEPVSMRNWQNTKLHVRRGVIEPRGWVRLPQGVMEFISSKADDAAQFLESLSPRQKQKIDDARDAGMVRQPAAEVFEAFARDREIAHLNAKRTPRKRDA